MMDSPFLYLLVGFLACFIGTIPFGPINLAVIKTTVDYDHRSGSETALAASLVNRLLAGILLFIGLSQGWNAVNSLVAWGTSECFRAR